MSDLTLYCEPAVDVRVNRWQKKYLRRRAYGVKKSQTVFTSELAPFRSKWAEAGDTCRKVAMNRLRERIDVSRLFSGPGRFLEQKGTGTSPGSGSNEVHAKVEIISSRGHNYASYKFAGALGLICEGLAI